VGTQPNLDFANRDGAGSGVGFGEQSERMLERCETVFSQDKWHQ
jgi:hypothetical protein